MSRRPRCPCCRNSPAGLCCNHGPTGWRCRNGPAGRHCLHDPTLRHCPHAPLAGVAATAHMPIFPVPAGDVTAAGASCAVLVAIVFAIPGRIVARSVPPRGSTVPGPCHPEEAQCLGRTTRRKHSARAMPPGGSPVPGPCHPEPEEAQCPVLSPLHLRGGFCYPRRNAVHRRGPGALTQSRAEQGRL